MLHDYTPILFYPRILNGYLNCIASGVKEISNIQKTQDGQELTCGATNSVGSSQKAVRITVHCMYLTVCLPLSYFHTRFLFLFYDYFAKYCLTILKLVFIKYIHTRRLSEPFFCIKVKS